MLKKRLSQHLLKDANLLKKMVRLGNVSRTETVVEIGAGQGDLTRWLAEAAGRVYAIEIDESFRPHLASLEARYPNLQILFGNALHFSFASLEAGSDLKVFGNIPYHLTGDILFKVLEERSVVRSAFFTMQKEVAERLTAKPGTSAYGALSVIFGLYAEVKLLIRVRAGLFIPPPEVDSAFVAIVARGREPVDQNLIAFIKECFRYKRKFLKHSLHRTHAKDAVAGLYGAMSFPQTVRAEELTPETFKGMYELLEEGGTEEAP